MSGIVGNNTNRGSGIVKSAAVGADSIDGSNIADDAIDSEHYTDGSIDNAHIADDAIDSEHYADGSIDNAHIADDAIDSEHYAAGSIDEAHIANDAINFATHLKAGTDGQIISWDASGDPVAVGPGSDGEVLTSTGAGSPPAFEAAGGGGAWNLIATSPASDSATLDVTGLSSTYDTYAIAGSDLVPETDTQTCNLRMGDSGGIDLGSSDYSYHCGRLVDGTGAYASTTTVSNTMIPVCSSTGNDSDEGCGFLVYLHRPGDGSNQCFISGHWVGTSNATVGQGGLIVGKRNAVITLDRVQIHFTNGDIKTGRLSVWGIAHA